MKIVRPWSDYGSLEVKTIYNVLRIKTMKEIAISKFKATCLAVLERVRKTGEPIVVTRFGQPIAEILPPRHLAVLRRFGARVGSMVILGDIVGPTGDESEWEAAQETESDPKDKGE